MKGNIRIIGGRWRGRKLSVPDRPGLRPSGDRVRETLFNWLAAIVPGARCLDLFAGSGALGIEAASRGATEVVLVERDAMVAAQLRAVRENWPDTGALQIECEDALRWLERAQRPFDIIFVDPPFAAELAPVTLQTIRDRGLLAAQGRLYLETDRYQCVPEGWVVLKEKRLGEVVIRLLGV